MSFIDPFTVSEHVTLMSGYIQCFECDQEFETVGEYAPSTDTISLQCVFCGFGNIVEDWLND